MWVGRKTFIKSYLNIIMKKRKERKESVNAQNSAPGVTATCLPAFSLPPDFFPQAHSHLEAAYSFVSLLPGITFFAFKIDPELGHF